MEKNMAQIISSEFPLIRKRRNRYTASIRSLLQETVLTTKDLVMPVFITDDSVDCPIASMPKIKRLTINSLLKECEELLRLGVIAIAPFPNVNNKHKTDDGIYATNPDGILPKALREVKKRFPEMLIFADIALDPYTSHGQDGIIDEEGYILNDITVEMLIKQALICAESGADFVAPSDMMDGRVQKIRENLEKNGLINTGIMAYSAKYASSYYGPFRDAVGSTANLGKSGKHNYQMDFANSDEALQEVALDIREGADIVMVKPATIYLDIIQRVKTQFAFPTAAYHVSGEYAMLEAAFANNWLDRDKIILETLTSIKRAGADFTFTYYAKEAAKLLQRG